MKTIVFRQKNESGQAAVETIFAVPIFLFLFLIGFQLFAITWNSQYVLVRARYDAIHQANHQPCDDSDGGNPIRSFDADVTSTIPGGMKLLARSEDRTVTHKAYIVCK